MKRNIDATQGPLLKKITLFALPIMATNILQMLYNIADQIVVGQSAGKNALSAVGCTGYLVNMTLAIMLGLSLGASVLTAQAFGAREEEKMNKILHTAMYVAVVGGFVFGALSFALSETFLTWMNTPKDIIADSTLYLRIYYCGMPFNFIYTFGAAMLRAIGDSKKPLIFLAVSGLLNVILNCILDFGFGLGVVGVAVGTVASQVFSSALVLAALLKGDGPLQLRFSELRFNGKLFGQILRVGVPCGIQSALFSFSNVVMQSSVNLFGSSFVAGSSASSSVEHVTYLAMHSFEEAELTFVGQNYGAKKIDRVYKTGWLTIFLSIVVGIILGNLSFLFRGTLVPLFMKEENAAIMAEVMQASTIRMAYVAIPYFVCGIMDALQGMLNGLGKNVHSMALSIIGSVLVRIVYVFAFFRPFFFRAAEAGESLVPSMHVLYAVYPLSWVITIALMVVANVIVKRQLVKQYGATSDEAVTV